MEYDYEKMSCLRKRRSELYKKMISEKEFKKRRKLELAIKIIDLKMEIEKLNQ